MLVTGAVMQPLSESFHNSNIGFAFTFINVAMWFAIFIIGILMNRFSIKLLLISATAIGIISSLIKTLTQSMLNLKI
ncbi:MFS transporter TsgA, partial [Francisella tularensis subsp. holarctica]|nr:MFS transporter TsgA [Francisella tularensis subsp. holarctica]